MGEDKGGVSLDIPALKRRGFLKYLSLSGLGAFVTACLSQNAPSGGAATATTAASGGGVGAPSQVARADAVTWKIQSGWAGNDIFQEQFLDWKNMVEEMSGGRIKIDALPVNAVTNINGAIDAVHSGTLDGAHHVPAYYYGKDHAVSLMGTGPMMGMSGEMWLGWYYYGGGQALYEKLVQGKLKLNVVSLFHMPMNVQPLGWFKDEIKAPSDFRGMKFRTVGLATGIYEGLGASVISVAGSEVASALDRGTIDAAEFNNTTSDTVYGLPDVRKILMARSYHQPSEILEISLNKTKYDGMPKELQAIMKYAAFAESANGEWKMMDRNSQDYAKLLARGIKIIKTPQSVLDAQLRAWDDVNTKESKDNPDYLAILKSQKAWAERIFPWADAINIPTPDPVSYAARPKV
ncbi:MAG: TRAP transporter substrate-binding protein [Chloroflexi bacterium]|nr:MAG: TRAP transporter substrate-binding protein [Chloroflexota bacterium]TMG40502.1 MAG: TRAP transporter substrate-binding protein [Chloroflexota bacterium]